ncbi:hypothetical protein DID88_010186 [Monilinia fructigena]|uniref:Uncharacterized protein n=1 Tax=Monilinia fructigena TaxID=38457 RepID=A0A395IKG8_9HELO|nr:hypothetical protein DID88_010186 [Monilinia fructigena]
MGHLLRLRHHLGMNAPGAPGFGGPPPPPPPPGMPGMKGMPPPHHLHHTWNAWQDSVISYRSQHTMRTTLGMGVARSKKKLKVIHWEKLILL